MIDRAAARALASMGLDHALIDFFPYGYDERQYNSPGFRLPVGSLMRGQHGQFPQYHTSADDLSFVREDGRVARGVGSDLRRRRRRPANGQRRAVRGTAARPARMYQAIGGAHLPDLQFAMLWVLNLSDGEHSLLDIADRRSCPSVRSPRRGAARSTRVARGARHVVSGRWVRRRSVNLGRQAQAVVNDPCLLEVPDRLQPVVAPAGPIIRGQPR